MTQNMEGIARLGRFEDDTLAHVATGEMIVPPVITPATRQMLQQDMQNVGLNPNEYMVGGDMSVNPNTGLPEFGFLSNVFKKIKKVVKKVAPIAINFIPGMQALGPLAKAAVSAGVGKASGMSTKDALLSGALSFGAGKIGQAVKGGKFTRIKDFFTPGEGAEGLLKSKFGIGKGTLGPNIRRGIGSLFGQAFTPQDQLPQVDVVDGGPFGGQTYTINGEPVTVAELQKMGYSFDAGGNPIASAQTSGLGGFMDGKSPMEFLSAKLLPQGVEDALGTGPGGSFLGGQQVDAQGNPIKGGGMGNLAVAGLAGLIGKLAYEEAKKNKGVPLTPLTTTDQLGRYNIAAEIARQKGEEMPSRVEFGLNPQGMPALQGGMPRSAAHGGIMAFADGGVVAMQEGGEPPIDPANFPVMDGQIDGPGTETSDDIPAMLSDGEFVMTAKAVKGAGSFDVATNDSNGIVTLTPNGDPSRDSGTRVMYKLMEHFGSMA